MKNRWILAIWMLALIAGIGQNRAFSSTNYFLVSELGRPPVHGDSFVIGLTNAAQIAHARDLAARSSVAGATIVLADMAAGADGINRDLLKPDSPAWSWHTTQVTDFGDLGIELLDGWPTFVESDVAGWIQNTGGRIGFWTYTVAAELPFRPQIAGIASSQGGIVLSLAKLTPPFPVMVEVATSLANPVWATQSNLVPQHATTNVFLPLPAGTVFIRLRVSPDP